MTQLPNQRDENPSPNQQETDILSPNQQGENNFEFSFKRRRYGRQFYTWAFVRHGTRWVSLGDPWPCVTPKRSELVTYAKIALGEMKGSVHK